MPRKPDLTCVACAQLSIAEAQHRHGPEGDDCWVSSRCHRRRSHYRHRGQVNVQRREQYRAQQHQVKVDEPGVEVDLPPAAYLYLYRAKRVDSPIHAVSASVWQDDQHLLAVRPIHCVGLTGRRLKQYLVDVLDRIHERYPQIQQFEAEIRLEPTECPIQGCPLKAPESRSVSELVITP